MKFRHEYKHPINLSDLIQLRTRLSAILAHDSHCGANGTYQVNSLYFDNYRDKALREKLDGVDKREKFRIRYYGDDTSFIRLEKKSKIHGLCSKESTRITAEQCQRILDGQIEFLRDSKNSLLQEFYAKMQYQLLRPKSIVVYQRESFVYTPGNVRVTLDFEIGGSTRMDGFLQPPQPYLRRYQGAILEVKWDAYLPELIRDAVGMKNRRCNAFSKYAAVRI